MTLLVSLESQLKDYKRCSVFTLTASLSGQIDASVEFLRIIFLLINIIASVDGEWMFSFSSHSFVFIKVMLVMILESSLDITTFRPVSGDCCC